MIYWLIFNELINEYSYLFEGKVSQANHIIKIIIAHRDQVNKYKPT